MGVASNYIPGDPCITGRGRCGGGGGGGGLRNAENSACNVMSRICGSHFPCIFRVNSL